MNFPQALLVTVYQVQYSEDLVVYWCVSNMFNRIPLIKHGEMFVPVKEHHTLMIFAAKIAEIAEMRMNGKYVEARDSSEQYGFQGMLFGNESQLPSEIDWTYVIFSPPKDGYIPGNFKIPRDRAKKELMRLLSYH